MPCDTALGSRGAPGEQLWWCTLAAPEGLRKGDRSRTIRSAPGSPAASAVFVAALLRSVFVEAESSTIQPVVRGGGASWHDKFARVITGELKIEAKPAGRFAFFDRQQAVSYKATTADGQPLLTIFAARTMPLHGRGKGVVCSLLLTSEGYTTPFATLTFDCNSNTPDRPSVRSTEASSSAETKGCSSTLPMRHSAVAATKQS
jgi:hypothetical protein